MHNTAATAKQNFEMRKRVGMEVLLFSGGLRPSRSSGAGRGRMKQGHDLGQILGGSPLRPNRERIDSRSVGGRQAFLLQVVRHEQQTLLVLSDWREQDAH